jgi:chromosome segregation ATPase
MKETSDAQEKAQLATTKYFNLKKEADESPLAVLRNELGTK